MWEDLNHWLGETNGGALGFPTAVKHEHFTIVGYPISQCLFSDADRSKLPDFFSWAGLFPGEETDVSELIPLLKAWAKKITCLLGRRPRRLLTEGSELLVQQAAEVVAAELQAWDGVVQGIHRIDELATARYTTQVVVTEEENTKIFRQPLPEFLTGGKLLLVAVGEVDAGVDLGALKPEDVRIVGNTVSIDLPDARILGSSLDEEGTKLYDRDRGLFKIRGNYELIEEARRDAEDRMVEAARENGILDKAQNNAETSIRTLVTSLGYDEVQFT